VNIPILRGFACHVYHWPPPEDADYHHVVPRAWQLFWKPPRDRFIVSDQAFHETAAGDTFLWDGRTVKLPPSCHRAVHNRIVALMKMFATARRERVGLTEPEVWGIASDIAGRGKLWEIALQGPTRFMAAGGSLGDLTAARMWGDS
jgi:hypothetical protein